MKERVAKGMGVVQSATPVSSVMENKMWCDGILGEHTTQQLLETIMQ